MSFTFGILDPSNWSQSDDLFRAVSSGGDVGDTFTINSYNYTQVTVEDNTVDDFGSDLEMPMGVSINGGSYSDGDNVENDYEVIMVDPNTGLYYRVNAITIDNDFVGVVVSEAWDATTGQYVGPPPAAGTTLTAIDGDDLDGTPNVGLFATDPNYTGEQGNDSEIGANNGVPICFAGDTRILTGRGLVLARDIRVGDRVATYEGGTQLVIWANTRHIGAAELLQNPKFRPIRIAAGALGDGLPERDLVVSPQHRVLIRSKIAQRMFGTDEVLVAARMLLGLPGINVAEDIKQVAYAHFMCLGHQVVFAEGAPAETLFFGEEARKTMPPEEWAEIELMLGGDEAPARELVNGKRARRLVSRHARSEQPLVA